MPNIPSIKIGDTTYDVKDQVARDHLVEVGTGDPDPSLMHPDNRLYIEDFESPEDEEANTYVIPTMEEYEDIRDHLLEVGTDDPDPEEMHPDNRLYIQDYATPQAKAAHTYRVPTMEEFETLEVEVHMGILGTKRLVFHQDGTVTWTNAST